MATKQEWIDAYQKTLDEYKNGTHKTRYLSCAKCKLCMRVKLPNCDKCIELLHDRNSANPCTARFSKPFNSENITYIPVKLKSLVLEYHVRMIDELKSLDENNPNWFENAQVIARDVDRFLNVRTAKER